MIVPWFRAKDEEADKGYQMEEQELSGRSLMPGAQEEFLVVY